MDGYIDTRLGLVKQIQAERRAEAANVGLAATGDAGPTSRHAERLALDAARLLVTVVLVTVGTAGLAGAGALLAGPTPADGPQPGLAD